MNGWTHTAVFVHKAGYDGIQIHATQGYIIAQFLSKATNKRNEEHDRSLANRARIPLEIAKSIRQKLPTGLLIDTKLNSREFQEDCFRPADCRAAELYPARRREV